MKRANEKALEEFPIVGDLHLRNAYISGYHQAERDLADAFQAEYAKELARADLALTADDIRLIIKINYEIVFKDTTGIKVGDVASEVLRRFRETTAK